MLHFMPFHQVLFVAVSFLSPNILSYLKKSQKMLVFSYYVTIPISYALVEWQQIELYLLLSVVARLLFFVYSMRVKLEMLEMGNDADKRRKIVWDEEIYTTVWSCRFIRSIYWSGLMTFAFHSNQIKSNGERSKMSPSFTFQGSINTPSNPTNCYFMCVLKRYV